MLISREDVIKATGLQKFGLSFLAGPLMAFFKINKVNESYDKVKDVEKDKFFEELLNYWDVKVELSEGWTEKVPEKGPIIFIANHPHGALDGVSLFKALRSHRKDFKFMGNFLLSRIKQIEDMVIPVNPLEKHKKAYSSLHGLRAALQHLADGGSMGIFPAAGMSHFKLCTFQNDDPDWNLSAAKFIRKAKCKVVPLYIHGGNSWRFHLAAYISRDLKLVQQVPETFRKAGETIKVSVGEPFEINQDMKMNSPEDVRDFLRKSVYQLRR